MTDAGPSAQVQRWITLSTTIIAPATTLGALLFYFGYVSSRAQYAYFGIDVDTIGLSTQDYVMRSPQPLLVPLLVLTLLGIGALLLHAAIRRRIGATSRPARIVSYRRLARWAACAGLALIGAGVLLLFSFPYLREWAFFDLVTPLVLAVGAVVFAYASRLQTLLHPRPSTASQSSGEASSPARAHADNSLLVLRRSATGLLLVVIVANIFWATATVAQWSGRGLAKYNAAHLGRLPSVILDTHERLFLRDPGVAESLLPASGEQTFHYRYRRLRLLIQGHDRMFLVPDKWSASDSTLVVPLGDSVRVQFQFQNDAP